jgi:Domain of unknown function (DUF4166)
MRSDRQRQVVVQESKPEVHLGDLRFRSLIPRDAWDSLPVAIRKRFSKRLSGGATAVYCGRMTTMRNSRCGWWMAQLLRLIGSPLPLHADIDVPSVVTVTEDMATSGQIWTRLYARRNGFPQIIQSSKRFAGPTGLEEYIGFGVTMAIKIAVEPKALVFQSAGYWLGFGKMRLRLPRFLEPGLCTVRHEETVEGEFRFSLDLAHPLLGELIHQEGLYRDQPI